jgi:hypothetical protein
MMGGLLGVLIFWVMFFSWLCYKWYDTNKRLRKVIQLQDWEIERLNHLLHEKQSQNQI